MTTDQKKAQAILNPPRTLAPPFVLGPYSILDSIGKGGMGVVFRAIHQHLQKQVAIKILPPESMSDAVLLARFRREMAAIGRLDHRNIVRATDAGEASGLHFLAMDLVDGIDLGKLIKLHGSLSVPDACAIICQAAEGLQCIHEHGLVHRDIKPSNLLLSARGEVKILDLGLALLQHREEDADTLTATNQPMGTYDYMAPEQWQSSHAVDIRADIYSLGCTLHTLLVGRPPFSGPEYPLPPSKRHAHIAEPFISVIERRPDVPAVIDELLKRMLAKEASDRPVLPRDIPEVLNKYRQGSALAALAQQTISVRKSIESNESDRRIPASEAVTMTQESTKSKVPSPLPAVHARKIAARFVLAAFTFIGVVAVSAGLLIDNSAPKLVAENSESPQEATTAETVKWEILPAELLKAGNELNLLEHPPVPLIWPKKNDGSYLFYDRERKNISAMRVGTGLLELGSLPGGHPNLEYSLDVRFSHNTLYGEFGIYFQGRENLGKMDSQAVIVQLLKDKNDLNAWRLKLEAFTDKEVIRTTRFAVDSLAQVAFTENELSLNINEKGLTQVHFNGQRTFARLLSLPKNDPPRTGPDGSFGIYLNESSIIIHSARLRIISP